MRICVRALMMGLALVGVGLVLAQDPAKKADDPAVKPVMKGRLPTHFKGLGLSEDQKRSIFKTQAEYGAKIDVLAQQIRDLRAKEREEILAVLTPAQVDALKKALAGDLEKKPPADSKPDSDKKAPDGVAPKKLIDK
jgi:hypothetical protein